MLTVRFSIRIQFRAQILLKNELTPPRIYPQAYPVDTNVLGKKNELTKKLNPN